MQPSAEQYTEQAWAAILNAQRIAKEKNPQQVQTEHLLIALIEQNSLAARFIKKAGASMSDLNDLTREYFLEQPIMHSKQAAYG